MIKMQNDEFLPVTNIHGQQYELERSFLEGVIIAAWMFQLLAVGLNLICYLIHPMAVDKSPTSKMFVDVLGRRFPNNGNIYIDWCLLPLYTFMFRRVKRKIGARGERGWG